jgi:hypothetical protein
MAEAMVVERWHTLLSVLPTLSGDSVDNFVKQQCVAKQTSLRAKYIYGKPRRTAPYHRVKSLGDCGVADALKYIGEIENM